MRLSYIILVLFGSQLTAQSPWTEIEGSLEIFQPHDSLSIHIGRSTGLSGSGYSNTMIGAYSGVNNVANYNSFFGTYAGHKNNGPQTSLPEGSANSYFGYAAGKDGTTSSYNSFFGYNVGRNNNGYGNTFIGSQSGEKDLLGRYNCFIGYESGQNNLGYIINTFTQDTLELASKNSFIGTRAGRFNETGETNTFVGAYAGYNNIGGSILNSVEGQYFDGGGSNNVFVGAYAGENNQTGQDNIYLGTGAGNSNVDGSENIMIGNFSGNNVNGSRNLFIGNGPYIPSQNDSIVNDQFYLGGYESTYPLLYGKFDDPTLNVYGDLNIGSANSTQLEIKDGTVQVKNNNSTADLYLNQTGGKVAIGSPSSFSDKLHINTSDGEGALRVQVDGVTRFRVRSNGGINIGSNTSLSSNVVYINSDYQLGVGVASPNATLHIKDFAKLEPQTFIPRCDSDIHEGRIFYDKTSKKFKGCIGLSSGSVSHGWVNLH